MRTRIDRAKRSLLSLLLFPVVADRRRHMKCPGNAFVEVGIGSLMLHRIRDGDASRDFIFATAELVRTEDSSSSRCNTCG
jgi:hypothetical protein